MGKSLIDRQQLSHQMGMQAIKKQTGKYDLGLLTYRTDYNFSNMSTHLQ
jgi:hypothetical protein